jgi:hypothetical protein
MNRTTRCGKARRFAVLLAALVACLCFAVPAANAGVGEEEPSDSDWLASLYGTWRLASVTVDGKHYKCPATYGQTGAGPLRCSAHEKLQLWADHSYRRTPKMFPWSTTRGTWAAWTGLIAFDDRDAEADPQAYRFKLKARELWIYVDLENPQDWQHDTHVVQKWVRAS